MAINFPDSPTTNDLFTSGGKTWEYDGTAWTIKAATTSIATGSITYDKLASDAVTTVKIADGAITAAKIADGTVVAAEIASSAITTVKINDLAVTTAKIADGAVTAAKLGNDISLTPADGSITQAKLGTTLSAVTVTTAANRDTAVASPFTGQLVFLTDTKKIQVWDGTSWLNITLAPPETPTSLSATALSTTSVSIAFTAGGANGSPITNYKYALSTNGGSTYGSFVALDPADTTTPITISGLTAATAYYIKLKAVNDMGDSVASAAVSIGTLSTPGAPTSLSATALSTTSVSVAFTPGAQNGSAITNYQYALSTNSGSTYGSFTALATPDATSPIAITGLTADTAYYVKLKAVNTYGAGEESSAVSVSTNPLLTVNYLVVAGGASGGTNYGGGGGAGGLRSTVTATGGGGTLETGLAPTLSTNYTVTVGAGGASVAGVGTFAANNGSNSVFSTITSIGGGGGGSRYSSHTAPNSGGSGGGAGDNHPAQGITGGAGTANQGYAGGGSTFVTYLGSGGGGAGAVGANSSTGGHGGIGVVTTISGSSVYYAGGGGGGNYSGSSNRGAGGTGGGGEGAYLSIYNGTAGTANTGGGGGGGGDAEGSRTSGAGGAGVVILRYSSAYTITIGAGLTGTTETVSSNKVTTITAGTGNVSWA